MNPPPQSVVIIIIFDLSHVLNVIKASSIDVQSLGDVCTC